MGLQAFSLSTRSLKLPRMSMSFWTDILDAFATLCQSEEEVVDDVLQELLKMSVITRTINPFNTPIAVVDQNGKFRVSFDARKLEKHVASFKLQKQNIVIIWRRWSKFWKGEVPGYRVCTSGIVPQYEYLDRIHA